MNAVPLWFLIFSKTHSSSTCKMAKIYTLYLKSKMAVFLRCKMAMISTLQVQYDHDIHLARYTPCTLKTSITLYSVYKNSEATLKPSLSKAFLKKNITTTVLCLDLDICSIVDHSRIPGVKPRCLSFDRLITKTVCQLH